MARTSSDRSSTLCSIVSCSEKRSTHCRRRDPGSRALTLSFLNASIIGEIIQRGPRLVAPRPPQLALLPLKNQPEREANTGLVGEVQL